MARPHGVQESGYESLAKAIVELAASDLICAFEYYKQDPERETKIKKRDEYVFFCSEWLEMLTDIDGSAIIGGIRKRVWDE